MIPIMELNNTFGGTMMRTNTCDLPRERETLAENKEKEPLRFSMCADVKMSRAVNVDVDNISPGGFGMIMSSTEITFDFESFYVCVNKDDPTIIHIEEENPDVDEFKDLEVINENHLKNVTEIFEFFVFTGEQGETDLRPVKLLACTFYTKSGEFSVSQDICETATVCCNIPSCGETDDSQNLTQKVLEV